MWRLLLIIIPLFCMAQDDWQADLADLNQQIENLTGQQEKLRAQAAWHQDEGDRWQFEDGRLVDARRVWALADQERKAADALQPQIDTLQHQRATLLQQHLESQEN